MREDFDKELWKIILCTEHFNGHSEEKRYHDVYKALFGAEYKADPKPPQGFTHYQMMDLVEDIDKNGNIEGTIKSFLKKHQPVIMDGDTDAIWEQKVQQEEEFDKNFNAIKQYLHRHKSMHQWELYRRQQKT